MAIGNDGNWVNADRPLDDANYMSIAEWCAWTTRVAAELLDKGGSKQLDSLRIKVQILSRETAQLMTDFNEQLLADGKVTEEEHAVAMEVNRNGKGTDEWNARSASGENTRDAKQRIQGKDKARLDGN
ncbi:MAG: hypothetical protein OXL96_27190 [Candidatus Poribacteria bacterium]|nr:hypothetical protein [Candidatus Poribacteria bacterium]